MHVQIAALADLQCHRVTIRQFVGASGAEKHGKQHRRDDNVQAAFRNLAPSRLPKKTHR
jgi:hypothetical protein